MPVYESVETRARKIMRRSSVLIIQFLLLLLLSILSSEAQTAQFETWQGKLIVGKQDSAIIYYGSESGDRAAFCFTNKSAVGRAVLSKCRNGKQCKFSGKVLGEGSSCNTAYRFMSRFKLGGFSYTGKIVSLKSVRRINKK